MHLNQGRVFYCDSNGTRFLVESFGDWEFRGRLLLAAKSLYSYSEVCVCVGGVKTQPFTVDVGLR